MTGMILVPDASALINSGGNSCLTMKSDAKKSALTNNKATAAPSIFSAISFRHLSPGRIRLSD